MTKRDLQIFNDFHRNAVGVEQFLGSLNRTFANSNNNGYPPYNIISHSDVTYEIEVAVAGFDRDSIDISVDGDTLTIQGDLSNRNDEKIEYIYKGIGARKFYREFTLGEHVEVVDASLKDGILSVELERKVPEEMKPKKIPIS